MIELALVAAMVIGMSVVLWWHDSRGPQEWGDLVSPEAGVLVEALRDLFRAEEKAVAGIGGPRLALRLVPERVALVRRLQLYGRALSAARAVPDLNARLAALEAAFGQLGTPGLEAVRERFQALDEETLASARELVDALEQLEAQEVRG